MTSKQSLLTGEELRSFDDATSHLQDWRQLLSEVGIQSNFPGTHRNDLFISRLEIYRRLDEIGLPTVPYVGTSLEDFLARPETHLTIFQGLQTRVTLEPNDTQGQLPTKRITNPVLSELVPLIQQTIDRSLHDSYSILLKEYIPNAYQVTVMVNSDQSITIEAVSPSSRSLQLNGTPEYRGYRDPILFTFKYDFENPLLRKLLYTAVQKIPHSGTGRLKDFMRGYYELIIAKRDTESSYKVFFDDFRQGSGFTF